MSHIKINGEVINLDCINFIKYDDDNFRIMIYTDDIYNLSYVITNKHDDDDKKKIWYNYIVTRLESKMSVYNWDKEFEKYFTKNFEQDIITEEDID